MRSILSKRAMENKKGQVLIINILFLFMAIAVIVGLIPSLVEMINSAKGSNALNCAGYVDTIADGGNYSYNSSIPSNSLACTFMALYIPYIVMVILIVGVAKLMANRVTDFISPQQQPGMYGPY